MPDLGEMHAKDWMPHLKSRFRVDLGGEEAGDGFEVELVEAEEMPTKQKLKDGQRRPYSLVFRAPHEPPLEQRVYEMTHPELGEQLIFLVPVNADEEGRYYEAVFT
jgi:hypothetical protein